MTEITRNPSEHSHQPDKDRIVRTTVHNAVKRKAVEDWNIRASKIVCSEMNAVQTGMNLNDYKNHADCVYRARLKQRPAQPKNLEDVFGALSSIDFTSHNIRVFESDPQTGIVVFSAVENIDIWQHQAKLMAIEHSSTVLNTSHNCTPSTLSKMESTHHACSFSSPTKRK